MCGDTSVHTSNLTKRIAELKSIDPSTNKTKFAIQLEVLESASTTDEEFDCSVAQLPDNAAKNRLKQHLPRESITPWAGMYMYPCLHVHVHLHLCMCMTVTIVLLLSQLMITGLSFQPPITIQTTSAPAS